jgi:hypothetical protein
VAREPRMPRATARYKCQIGPEGPTRHPLNPLTGILQQNSDCDNYFTEHWVDMVAASVMRCAEETDTGFCAPKVAPHQGVAPAVATPPPVFTALSTPHLRCPATIPPPPHRAFTASHASGHARSDLAASRNGTTRRSGNPTTGRPGTLLNPPARAELTSNTGHPRHSCHT